MRVQSAKARRKQEQASEALRNADSTVEPKCCRRAMTRPAQNRKKAISKLPEALSISRERMLRWNITPSEAETPAISVGSAIDFDIRVSAMIEMLSSSSHESNERN